MRVSADEGCRSSLLQDGSAIQLSKSLQVSNLQAQKSSPRPFAPGRPVGGFGERLDLQWLSSWRCTALAEFQQPELRLGPRRHEGRNVVVDRLSVMLGEEVAGECGANVIHHTHDEIIETDPVDPAFWLP